MYKRTGFPSTESTLITWEPIYVAGVLQKVPRRNKFSTPVEGSENYENQMKRFEEMEKDPNFGALDNEYGRVWWDY